MLGFAYRGLSLVKPVRGLTKYAAALPAIYLCCSVGVALAENRGEIKELDLPLVKNVGDEYSYSNRISTIGISLGKSIYDVERIIEKEKGFREIRASKSKLQMEYHEDNIKYLISSRDFTGTLVYQREYSMIREEAQFLFTSPASGSVLYAIVRNIHYKNEDRSRLADVVIRDLENKYRKLSQKKGNERGVIGVWFFDARGGLVSNTSLEKEGSICKSFPSYYDLWTFSKEEESEKENRYIKFSDECTASILASIANKSNIDPYEINILILGGDIVRRALEVEYSLLVSEAAARIKSAPKGAGIAPIPKL